MDTIDITLPVTHAAAEHLREPGEQARLGALVSLALAGNAAPDDLAEAVRLMGAPETERRAALRAAIANIQRAAAEAGLTRDEIEVELAAWRRERREARMVNRPARRR